MTISTISNSTLILMWKTTPPLCLSVIIKKWVILALFLLEFEKTRIWAVAGESGIPIMWKRLLTIKGSLFKNSFPSLSFWWTSGYLTVALIFYPCKIESKHFTWFVGLGDFVSGPFLLFFVHDMKSWHLEFTTKMKYNQVMYLCFSPWMLISTVPAKAFLSFHQWGSNDWMEMTCDN